MLFTRRRCGRAGGEGSAMWLPKGLILRVPRTQVSSHTLTLGTAHPREDPRGSEGPGPSLPPGPRSRSSHWGPAGHSSDTCFVVFSHSKSSHRHKTKQKRVSRLISQIPGSWRGLGSEKHQGSFGSFWTSEFRRSLRVTLVQVCPPLALGPGHLGVDPTPTPGILAAAHLHPRPRSQGRVGPLLTSCPHGAS